jgi:hypothetical protein
VRRSATFLPVLLFASPRLASPPAPVAPHDGAAVVKQMHDRYEKTWYRTLTFVQTTTNPGRPDQTWYEAGSIPGKLRIDVEPLDSMNAFMYVGDSAYVFRAGKLVNARADRNLLMTLGFDVYGQPVETTIAQLRAEGIDLSKVREDTWKGAKVWVVGAAAGDTTSSQFWIEQKRLLFVRLIEQRHNPAKPDAPPAILDAEFNNYQPLGKAWVAPECVIRVNGREIQREAYRDIKADVALPAALYDTREYHRPEWLK